MKNMTGKFPKYYVVGDCYVVVDYDSTTDEVYATNHLGSPYPVYKPLIEGSPIPKNEYDDGVKEIRQRLGLTT